jgi:hypothetical protein
MTAGRWKSATVVCVASGPSLTTEDCAHVEAWRAAGSGHDEDRRVIVVNTSFLRVPTADVLYAGDFMWWCEYAKQVAVGKWPAYAGERWSLSAQANAKYGTRIVPHNVGAGLADGAIYSGGNGGYQAVQLAALFGAGRIVLVGYDLQRTGGKSHWHGDHPQPLGNGGNLAEWARRLDQLSPALAARGICVINATRETALRRYSRATITEALAA